MVQPKLLATNFKGSQSPIWESPQPEKKTVYIGNGMFSFDEIT
jgi:hypothetical protein